MVDDQLFNGLVERIAALVLERLQVSLRPDDLIDQHSTPLGKRAHCALTRRLAAQKHPGAAIIGRRMLLSRKAITEHLAGLHSPKPYDQKRVVTAGDKVRAELASLRCE